MKLTRRDALALGLGSTAASFLPAATNAMTAEEAIVSVVGYGAVGERGVSLDAPDAVKNGETALVSVDAPGAVSIIVLAPGNRLLEVAAFNFAPDARAQTGITGIQLDRTQDLVALAKMADGSYAKAVQRIRVINNDL